jgi:DNA ligase (NAD+)
LNNKITKERNVNFFAFSLVDGEDVDFKNSFSYQLGWIKSLGFDVVENFLVDGSSLPERVKYFSEKISRNDFPSDGLVLVLDDIAYGKSLGRTAKFPRNAMAFKWADEQAITHLVEVCWSPSRTGLINPIAVFEPVELEGTTVSRASLHNVSILKSLQLGIGDEISVYKANMIIPQIAENFTRSGTLEIPKICPVCGGEARIRREGQAVFDLREAGSEIVAGDSNGLPAESMATSSNSGEESAGAGRAELNTEDSNKDGIVETLYCINKFCPAKKIKSFSHFVSREAMNIDGVSQATLEKFIDENILETLPDIYHLADHREKIVGLEGFGEKSYNKLCDSIDKSRKTDTWRLVNALGIPNVGEATAKLIARHFDNDMKKIMAGSQSEFTEIEGIGDVVAASIVGYFNNESNCDIIDRLMDELSFAENTEQSKDNLSGQVFVITGSLTHFENRNQLKELIENQGGKVTGSVSANTTYLINNDVNSTSSKNKKAKSLGIPIISEEDFIEMFKD